VIEVYISERFPFCQKVLRAADEMGLQKGKNYQVIDASAGTAGREKVLEVGGKGMVPFLIDGEHSMYESDDIVQYLRDHL
jgi:glutathione S-transferase